MSITGNATALADTHAVLAMGSASAQQANGHTVRELTDREAIVAVADAWRALESSSVGSTAFQRFAFALPWLDIYAFGADPSHKPLVVCVHNASGKLVALAPFVEKHFGSIRLIEWLGEPLIQYGDILLDPEADAQAVGAVLQQTINGWRAHGLLLRNVRADARVGSVLDLTNRRLGETRQAAIADLEAVGSADAYFARFSRSTRRGLRGKRRKLEEMGAVTFDIVEPGPQAPALCKLALEWKKGWLAERGLSSRAFVDGRSLDVLQAIAANEAAGNPLKLGVLRLDDQPIAIEIALVDQAASMAFMGMYDPRYHAQSPGKIQMQCTVRHVFEAGWKAYDLLAPMADYKASWSTRQVDVVDHMIPLSLLGRAYRDGVLRGLRPLAKKTLMALPSKWRARILGNVAA